jgi:hypothetical protein
MFASGGAAGSAGSNSGFYLASRPGTFVFYLSLTDSGSAVSGYLEAIRASRSGPDGQTRTQTFATYTRDALSFGNYTATRTPDGYTLTGMTPDGQVVQQHFVRSSVQEINKSIAALSASVNHARAQLAPPPAKTMATTPQRSAPLSAADSGRLARAQAAIDAATAQVATSKDAIDRLAALARQARAEANAAIDEPGVTFAQNQKRVQAMNLADQAELTVVDARRQADVSAAALDAAKAAIADLRTRIAKGPAHGSAPNAVSDEGAGP